MELSHRHFERLAGKVVLVTGAGSQGAGVGTGKAISVVFAREGARVCLVDRDPARAEDTARRIRDAGGHAIVVPADVTDESACAAAVAATVDQWGTLDVLVNNVGVGGGGGTLEGLAPAEFDRLLNLNFRSAYLMSRAAMKPLLASRGNVVNIVSTAGLRAHGSAVYGPSKAALLQFTGELAVMYGRQGVRANAVAPGHIFTPLVTEFIDDAGRERRRRIAPLNVEGDAWDVAFAALFLASDEARFVTGACIPVDGGVTQVAALAAHEMM